MNGGDPRHRLEHALDVFEATIAPAARWKVKGCRACYGADQLRALAGPPSLVEPRLLNNVATEVTDHWGDFPRFYRRMLPAILRSAATREPMFELDVVGARIAEAQWQTWPAAERRALVRVLHRWWQVALLTETDVWQLRGLLDLLVEVTRTLGPWLRRWTVTTGPGPDELLVAFAERVLPDALVGSCRFGWSADYDGTRELTAWLLEHVWLRVGVRPDGAYIDEACTFLLTYPPDDVR